MHSLDGKGVIGKYCRKEKPMSNDPCGSCRLPPEACQDCAYLAGMGRLH